jgi:hypothetical protein
MFHPCQNPSVYVDPDGKLRMLANFGSKGMWESESLDGGWRCLSPDFPPGGDCTIYFRWGRFDYIIGGFSGFWSKSADAPVSAYEDLAVRGLDFYDGSNVPAVTEIADGRFLMAAWVPIRGWGGTLVIRELVQFPDGRIGSKWMNEITPRIDAPIKLAAEIAGTAAFPTDIKSFELSFTVHAEDARKGKVGISFLPEHGDQAGREWQICLDDMRAQFGPGSTDHFTPRQKSLREGGSPPGADSYAIENLIGVNKPFTVRVVVKNSVKIGGSLIDAEIAGQRTMISHCPELTVRKMVFRMEGIKIKDLQIGRQ